MNTIDEQRLDDLLNQTPAIRDDGFSERVNRRIQTARQRRLGILGAAWISALIVVVFTLPLERLKQVLSAIHLPSVFSLDYLQKPYLSESTFTFESLLQFIQQPNSQAVIVFVGLCVVMVVQWLLQEQ
jgi:hypothetical protein